VPHSSRHDRSISPALAQSECPIHRGIIAMGGPPQMRVPHPQNGSIVFRLGIAQSATALLHLTSNFVILTKRTQSRNILPHPTPNLRSPIPEEAPNPSAGPNFSWAIKHPRRRRFHSAEGRSAGEAETTKLPSSNRPRPPGPHIPCQPPPTHQNRKNPHAYCPNPSKKFGVVIPPTSYNGYRQLL
jgi:hypothetical protein